MKDLMNELKDAAQLEEIRSSKEISVALFSAAWCPDCRFISKNRKTQTQIDDFLSSLQEG